MHKRTFYGGHPNLWISLPPFSYKLTVFLSPPPPSPFTEVVSNLKRLQMASSNKTNSDVDDLIRRKVTKVTLRRTSTHTPQFQRTAKRKKPVLISFLPHLTSQLCDVIKSMNKNPIQYPYSKLGRLFHKETSE